MKASKLRFPVLRVYFKVVRRTLPTLMIYILFSLLFSVLFTKFGDVSSAAKFTETKSSVAFVDADNTPLTEGLKKSLSPEADFVNISDKGTALSDALFYHDVQYVLRIPKGFTAQFLSGKAEKLDKTEGENAASGVEMDLVVNRYLNTARLYRKSLPNLTERQLAALAQSSAAKSVPMTYKSSPAAAGANECNFFIYNCYTMVIMMFFVISTIMMIFGKKDLLNRNLASPYSRTSQNLQLFAGHFLFMLILLACCVALGAALGGPGALGTGFWLLSLNLLCLALACLGLSFLLGNFVKNRGAQNGIANALTLGLSFISGVFVPQNLLSGSLTNVARFTPTYWYVKAANDIGSLSSFNTVSLSPARDAMLIELGFAAVFLAAALALTKQRNTPAAVKSAVPVRP